MTITATLLCQLGMTITCLPAGSVMHMPTLASTALVAAVAFFMAVLLELLTEYVFDYGPLTANGLLLIAIFLFAVSVLSFFYPVIANDGRVAFKYPTLAVMGFAELTVILLSKKVKPAFGLSKFDWKEPGNVFLLLCLIIGIALCIILPHETVLNFDDETHYKDSISFSQGLYTVTDDADVRLFCWFWDKEPGLTVAERTESDAALNAAVYNGNLYVDANRRAYDLRNIGYIGTAAGIWLGNALGLPATARFTLARIGCMALYAVLMSLAIKRLKSGKILLFLIGINPYAVYSAACFNYDAWMLSMTALGFACFLGALQRPEEKLTTREIIIMLGALALGILPKTPYIPLLLIPFLMPRDKFANEKQRKRFYLALCLLILALVVYTLIYTFGSGDPVDDRSNEQGNVSGIGQLTYILSNPFGYLEMLLGFLFRDTVPTVGYLTTFVYLGNTNTFIILTMAMAAVAVTDNSGIYKSSIATRILGIVFLLAALMLAATSMYMVFTPVGAATINGCQSRYTVHLLFPFFMFALNGFIQWNPPRRIYNPVFYALGTGVLLFNIYKLVILPGL